ncbi:MAG: SCO family protein [Acidilobaceae archaeon]
MGTYRLLLLAGLGVTISLVLALAIAYAVGSILVPWLAGESPGHSAPYSSVFKVEMPVRSFKASSTKGLIEFPVSDRINIITPQYVRCPDICHWETNILIALFEEAYKANALDRIAFITIGLDPWDEDLNLASTYQEARAGEWLKRGVYWAWIYDNITLMRDIWNEYRIYVEKDEKTRLINHFAGFIIVKDGKVVYVVVPTTEGWSKPANVAKQIWELVDELMKATPQDHTHHHQ